MRDFEKWLGTMRECINSYDYYVNFQKVYENAGRFKVELNLMNSLIGSKNIQQDFKNLTIQYPSVLHCVPTLLAVRQAEIYAQDDSGAHIYNFLKQTNSLDEYIVFMEKTGLFDLIANHLINNLYDYAVGVEVGLDSNGRKNRGGHQMENLVEGYIKKADVEYYKEMYITEIENRWNLDLSMLSGENTSTKRWDFVVKTDSKVFLIETNFYASSGSKLNETEYSDGIRFIRNYPLSPTLNTSISQPVRLCYIVHTWYALSFLVCCWSLQQIHLITGWLLNFQLRPDLFPGLPQNVRVLLSLSLYIY